MNLYRSVARRYWILHLIDVLFIFSIYKHFNNVTWNTAKKKHTQTKKLRNSWEWKMDWSEVISICVLSFFCWFSNSFSISISIIWKTISNDAYPSFNFIQFQTWSISSAIKKKYFVDILSVIGLEMNLQVNSHFCK